MLPANCCCCLLPLLVSAARGCCELLMAGAARFADCGSVGRTGALLGRLGALVHRLGVSGDRLAQSWGRPRPLSSRLRRGGSSTYHPPSVPPSSPSSPLPPSLSPSLPLLSLPSAPSFLSLLSPPPSPSWPRERHLEPRRCETVSGETGLNAMRAASRVSELRERLRRNGPEGLSSFLFLSVRRLTAGKNTHPGAQR